MIREGSVSEELTIEKVQELITRGPYHQWLGLKVIALYDDGIEIKATWREEWVVIRNGATPMAACWRH